jgi:hypothetical protein
MKYFAVLWLFLSGAICFGQEEKPEAPRRSLTEAPKEDPKAPIDQYRIITLERDTTFVDTSLTIQSEYRHNYLRRDTFGLMPFPNEGQPYNTLQVSASDIKTFPAMGYKAKHFAYIEPGEMRYYSVATPFTDLYFKSVMEQGQTLDAFIAVNTSENFNFSVAYKGLRSLGKYINQLTSAGNLRFTASYKTTDVRYVMNLHFTGQDILNGENGGIANMADFESEDNAFRDRSRLEVYFRDAESFLKGKRLFVDHSFRVNKKDADNNLFVDHQFNYEDKFFEFRQATVVSSITNSDGQQLQLIRYGQSYVPSNIHDQVRYNHMYNKIGATYENKLLGKFRFFIEDYRYNYFYDRVLVLDNEVVPGLLSDEINTVGGQYEYRKGKWKGVFTYSNSVSNTPMTNLDAKVEFAVNDRNTLFFQYKTLSKVPNLVYNLHQSSYAAYNWANDFKNEKANTLRAVADTQWGRAELELTNYNDYLYFFNDDIFASAEIVTPQQYADAINYVSLKVAKEFRAGKFALGNTVLYQKVAQDQDILNVPEIVTRNTLYFSDYFFKRALFVQTGVTVNYFTKYYMNGYNPMIGELFVQNDREFGNFPMLDFFVNARVRQTRFYLKAEHFNSAFTGNDFYSAPGYPYRDFIVRFGLVWNFFQ